MNLYEIDERMMALIDTETGEILDYEAFESLMMEKDAKIDNLALWCKDLAAEEDALDREIKNLSERRDSTKRKRERLMGYLQTALQGEKRKTSRYVINYRRSESCEIADEKETINWLQEHGYNDCLNTKVSVSKSAVKELLKNGQAVTGARLVEKQNMSIK